MKTLNFMHWSLKARRTLIVVQLSSFLLAIWLSKFSQTATDPLTLSALAFGFIYVGVLLFSVYAGRELDPIRFHARTMDEWQLKYRNEILSKSFGVFSGVLVTIGLLYFLLPDSLIWIPERKEQMASLVILIWSFMSSVPLWISMWVHPEFEG